MAVFQFFVCLALCCSTIGTNACAQDNYRYSDQPRKKSAMEKLSDLNRKLKKNIKQGIFGESGNEGAYRTFQNDRSGYRQHDRSLPNDYDSRRRSDIRLQQYESSTRPNEYQRASQAQYNQDLEYRQPQHQNDSRSQRPHLEPRDEYRNPDRQLPRQDARQIISSENYLRPPTSERYREPPMQVNQIPAQEFAPPVPQYEPPNPAISTRQNGQYGSGQYQNNNLTQQQFDQQETATQRVLRLKTENMALLETRQSLTAENKRLKAQLREKNELLKEIAGSIDAARTELQRAKTYNTELREQIASLESEKAKQFRESTNRFNAIRKKLDDVLMMEMTNR